MTTPIRNLIIDMDGVLWRGETPMPTLPAFFDLLDRLQVRYVLATNNATKVAFQYAEKLARFGVEVDPACILTSAEATAAYLRQEYAPGTLIYVVGEQGLETALTEQGFELLRTERLFQPDVQAELVVVGFTRHVTYRDLANATLLIRKGARFVGTNPDRTFPHELGQLPGAGSLLAFLEAATGVTPTVVGKPSKIIFEEALRRLNGRPEETVMIGDRLETDIAGARAAGLRSVLLLSGVTTAEQAAENEIQATWVLDDIQALATHLEENGAGPL